MASTISAGTTSGTALNFTGDTSGNLAFQTGAGANIITVPNVTGTILTTGSTGVCRAWLTYNGNSNTILASYNISSVTNTGTGLWTVNFTNSLTDGNYAIGACADYAGVADVFLESSTQRGNSASAAYIRVTTAVAPQNATFWSISIFR